SNLLFDLFAGGALAAVLVPALSAALAGDDPAEAQRSASAFANTVLLLLTPVVLAGIALRGPIMAALTSGVGDPAIRSAERDLGGFFLLLFLPQVWLYGIRQRRRDPRRVWCGGRGHETPVLRLSGAVGACS